MRAMSGGVLVALALSLSGCGGAGSPHPSAALSSSASPSASSGGASLSGTMSPAPAPSSSSAASASSAATPSGRATTGPAAAVPGKPSGFARAGTYTYDLSGTATSALGSQQVSGTATSTDDSPAGGRQHSTTKGPDGSQEQTLESRSTGLYVVDLAIHQHGFDEDFTPVGSALFFPADYRVGRSWSWSARSTDGKYLVEVTSQITSTESVVVGGRSLPSLVVDSTLHFTGSNFDLTDKQRDWVSTQFALILKEHSVTKGTVYGYPIKSDTTRVLRSTTPG